MDKLLENFNDIKLKNEKNFRKLRNFKI